MLLPDELDIIVDGLLADVRKVRIMFPQVVAIRLLEMEGD